MTVSEVISPGDKIDIRLLQDAKQNKDNQVRGKNYKSQVLDVMNNGNIEISMPIEKGKLVLLPLGVRYEFIFYSMGSLYRGIGQIKERYKRENVYMLQIELKSQLEKFQRREYYRFSCIMDITYYQLTKEEAEAESANAIFVQLQQEEDAKKREKKGRIIDISGGGMKFRAAEEIKPEEKFLLSLHLKSDKIDKQHYILGEIISCILREQPQQTEYKYEMRVKFLIEDDRVREEIIRYIFEEERKTRQKGKKVER